MTLIAISQSASILELFEFVGTLTNGEKVDDENEGFHNLSICV